ncbi:EI24 domain-containing protein [Sphingomonas floccifaciens]|uniref:EI24 domain-containing protein n=1 Tax=Sphingomonas floccifaciens TaxID=1844115 RepID=A0ABW4NE50_9SPHN
MIAAFFLSVGQLGDRRILAVLAKSLALTFALLATAGVGIWFGVRALAGWMGISAVGGDLAGAAAVLAGVALGWLIFRALAIAVIGIFADDVVAAVEAKHYPAALASAKPVPFARGLAMGGGSAARAVLWNVAAAPLYLILLATGVGTAIGFFVVNALLLGRDLGDMVAARHRQAAALPAFRQETRAARLLLGAIGTALLLIPFVNLLAPVLGAAMATHVFHRRLSK